MYQDIAAAHRALGEAADLLERAATRASEHPNLAQRLEEYVTSIDKLRRELEMDTLAGERS